MNMRLVLALGALVTLAACTTQNSSHISSPLPEDSVIEAGPTDTGTRVQNEELDSSLEEPPPDTNNPQEDSTQTHPGPVTLSAGEHTPIHLGEDNALIRIERDGNDLIAIPLSGLQLGVVETLNDELNYNPYRITPGTMGYGSTSKPENIAWHGAAHVQEIVETETGVKLRLVMTNERESTLEVHVEATDRVSFTWVPPADESLNVYRRIRARTHDKEGFYGLGGVLDQVNHRGKIRAMNNEIADLESGHNETHVPIPLLMGTTGWGLFVESYRPGVFEVAVEEEDLVQTTFGFAHALEEPLQFHIFTATHPVDLTLHYYQLTGFPGAVAPWALGPWIWRDEVSGQEAVEEDLQIIRDEDLATTGYWIDRPYATDVNSFDFNPALYSDPSAMIAKAHDLGFEVALWHTPYVDPEGTLSSALFEHATENGFFAPLLATAFSKWGPPLDFSNPDAVAWWRTNLETYRDLGITGYKLDFGQEVITGFFGKRFPGLFADGSDEFTMHRRYSILYHEAYRPMIPEEGGFLLCRAGSFGDQVNGCVIWPGDIDANFAQQGDERVNKEGESYKAAGGLPGAVVMGSSLGVSGYPLFASDTGGYLNAPPTKECFLRWTQFSAFSPAMQVGTNTNDLPWSFGESNLYDSELLDIYRLYARIHLRLYPYLWTAWKEVQETGRAIQRPLGFAYPELEVHPNDTYLLGEDILVAPVIMEGQTERAVVLPPGTWVNWWTGKAFTGGTEYVAEAPLGVIPVFVRAGAPIPMLRPTIDTYRPTNQPEMVDSFSTTPHPLYVRVTAGEATQRVLYDGTILSQSSPDPFQIELNRTGGSVFDEDVVFQVHGVQNPSLAGITVSLDTGEELPEGVGKGTWKFGEGDILEIHLTEQQTSILVEILPAQ